MIFGFFPFLFLPLFPILRYVAGHCPAIHSLHLFIVYLLAWWFCIQLSFLFLLCAFIFFFFFSLFCPQFLIFFSLMPFCLCNSSSFFFFLGLILVSAWFPCMLTEGRVSVGINCHSGLSSYRILCSLFLRSQLFNSLETSRNSHLLRCVQPPYRKMLSAVIVWSTGNPASPEECLVIR